MGEGKEARDGQGDAAPRVSIGRLPATGRALFGREAELAWLEACWQEGVGVASVVAFGGVGKTALVNRWLAGLRDKEWDGARRVFGWSFYSQGTERLSSSDEFVEAALRWFGDPEPGVGSPWDRGERLAELVARERSLLVLDGVEPLQWGPGVQEGRLKDQGVQAVLESLGAQNRGMCLVTTRIALADLEQWSGDKVRSRDLGNISPEAGAELLKARGVQGTEEELREAAREYKGHGLALTLLGSYLADVAEGDVRRRKEIGPLEEDERQGGHARRVMGAYEGWLGKAEVAILHMIGLFDRPADEGEIDALRAAPPVAWFTEALAGVGAREWSKAMAKLQRAGLLLVEPDRRLDAHPLVREHFGEQLRKGQPEAWREGHRRLYEHLKASAKELPETIEEMGPLYAAVAHGCLAGKAQEALDEIHWKRIRRGDEAFSITQLGAFDSEVAVLSAFFDPPWERLVPGLSERNQGWILSAAGFALSAQGRLRDATDLMRVTLKELIAQELWGEAADQAANMSELLKARGELHDAEAVSRQSVGYANRSDGFVCIFAKTALAAVLHALGHNDDAALLFEEAERIQRADEPRCSLLYGFAGFLYCDMLLDGGQEVNVVARAMQTLLAGLGEDSILDMALTRLCLGRAHDLAARNSDQPVTKNHAEQAADYLEQAVGDLRRAGQRHHLPLGLLARAALHTHTRAFPAAHRDLAESLSLSDRCGFRLHLADTHLAYARLHLAEGHPGLARPALAAARALIAETGYHRRDGELADLSALCAKEEEALTQRRGDAEAQKSKRENRLSAPLRLCASAFNSGSPSAPDSAPQPLLPSIATPMPNLPVFRQPLLDAYRDRKLGVLFGSGLSMAPDVAGKFPSWDKLPERFIAQVEKHDLWDKPRLDAKRASFAAAIPLEEMLAELDVLRAALKRAHKYQAALNAIFRPGNAAAGAVHRALVALDVAVLATTNYDQLLEHEEGSPKRNAYTWRDADKALSDIEEGRKVLFKLHGSAENEGTVVMTRREYDEAAKDASYQRIMSHLLKDQTFLLVGYGINDPLDLDLVFGFNAGAFGVTSRTHYALVREDLAKAHGDRWQREMNIQTIPYVDHADLPAILAALAQSPRNPP